MQRYRVNDVTKWLQDGRQDSKMAAMAPIQAQLRVTTSDDPVTRSVSPRKVS